MDVLTKLGGKFGLGRIWLACSDGQRGLKPQALAQPFMPVDLAKMEPMLMRLG